MIKNLVLVIILIFLVSCNTNKIEFVSIGTGSVTGVYYPAGGAISRMVNNNIQEYNLKMTVESTGGSVYNINAVLNNDIDFGIAQSDRQFQAYFGQKEWERTGNQSKLRSVFSLHPESITLITSEDSNIFSIEDLKERRINLGNPGSGQLQNSLDILNTFNISLDDIIPEYVKAIEAPGLLQDERLDAFFYTVGHPNGNIKEATSGRIKTRILSISGKRSEHLLSEYSYYAKAMIPIEFYPNSLNTEDIETIGVKATLITSIDVPENVVYAITKEVFDNLEEFKELHPAFRVLTRENMLEGLTAPLHPGALKYYKEVGLLDKITENLLIE